jgi:outer membrane protein assembly factor BamB
MKPLPFVGFIAALSVAVTASAQDWPGWRGAKRDGLSTETGLLKQWPAAGPKLAWKATGIGGGFSSVSLVGNRIYTMGDGPSDLYVHALDRATGKIVWSTKAGLPGGHRGYPGPRSTPTVDGDALYVLTQHGDLICLGAAKGDIRWQKSLEEDFGGKMMSGWRYSESPLVDGDKVVATPGGADGAILALNKQTGAMVWRTKDFTDPAAYSSLVPVTIGGTSQYLQFTGQSVVGVASASGTVLWRADRPGKTAVIPTPVYKDNHVFVTSGYKIGCNLFKISGSGNAFKAEPVYANTDMQVHHGGVILVGDHVYGASDPGILTCMEMKSGKVKWAERSVGKGALAYADGHLYLRSEGKGEVALVEATPAGYNEKGRFTQPERTTRQAWPHPVIAAGKLYLRDQDMLFCYDLKGN